MKLQFDSNLDFQKKAIESITSIFKGQEICNTNFTVPYPHFSDQLINSDKKNNMSFGNHLKLSDKDILNNICKIQLKNGLAPLEKIDSMNFTIEMETGTGKTYVYLRSIFEMNRLYGFVKFIIVVPSIAIKEGVYKSLQITVEHFKNLYKNVCYDYFVYDSNKLSNVINFATSPDIQIMVINIDAFRKSFIDPKKKNKTNIIHRYHDRFNGSKPIECIQDTNPIVIIDEPQSVDTTYKSEKALASLNPLCTLRFSATHIKKYHMIYKLDSVDAYEQKLVKQIEVAGIEIKYAHNRAYIKLLSVNNKKNPITAKLEIESQLKNGRIKRKIITVSSGANLLDIKYSGGRDVYDGYIIENIYCNKGNEYINFCSNPDILKLGQTFSDVDPDDYKRLQIRKTIEEHLNKEKHLHPKGIKVLSLFFIDRVSNYRFYDNFGNPQKGKYAMMFEEEYSRAIKKYSSNELFKVKDMNSAAASVHNGYFSIDNKKDAKGNELLIDTTGKTADDESVYNLIMKDKEKLLSFNSRLKFIFSHSTLKEGWDNPNVFQICTLNETNSVTRKRQEIGRGLRIAVNQKGERVHGFEVNTLTIMANESFEKFASLLQKEIEQEKGIKFGVVEEHLFANIVVQNTGYNNEHLGVKASKSLCSHLKTKGYINDECKIQDSLKKDLKTGKLKLSKEFKKYTVQITALLKKASGNLIIKNHDNKKKISLNKATYLSDEFKQLWDHIKYHTTFRINFDVNALILKCVKEIKTKLQVNKTEFVFKKTKAQINHDGVHTISSLESANIYEPRSLELPDLITYLQNETNLTRRTIVKIIKNSGSLEFFKVNPQKFIEKVSIIIKKQMQLFMVDGIKYHRICDGQYFTQELFKHKELFDYLHKSILKNPKSVFYQAGIDFFSELNFANVLQESDHVKLYAKLPNGFKINTPLGNSYNPDWAVLIEEDDNEKLYFVVENKKTLCTK